MRKSSDTQDPAVAQQGSSIPVDGSTVAADSRDATESPIFGRLVTFMAAAIGLVAAIWSWRALHNDFQKTVVVVGVMC